VVFHSYVSLPEGNVNLVGGFDHLEKYEFVNGKVDIPYIMEHKTCLKPAIFFFVVLACYPLRKTKNNDHQDKPTGGNTTGPAVKQFAQRPRKSCTCGKKSKKTCVKHVKRGGHQRDNMIY
jgi:hypothetical protein